MSLFHLRQNIEKIRPLTLNAEKEFRAIPVTEKNVSSEMVPSLHKIPPIIESHLIELPKAYEELGKLQQILQRYEGRLKLMLENAQKAQSFNGPREELFHLFMNINAQFSEAHQDISRLQEEALRIHKELLRLR